MPTVPTVPTGMDGPKLSVNVAALNLQGVGDVVWDVEVVNGADPGQVVWQKRLASSGYGDGAGSASYVETCDADPAAKENTVKVWVVGVYDAAVTSVGSFNSGSTAGVGAVTGSPVDFQNPTASGALTQVVTCVDNADAAVQFDVALMRPAQQGFFDIAVNFNNIFCSAKFDCCVDTDANGCAADGSEDIKLLFDASGSRSSTMVLGFACTAGATAGVETELYLDPLQLDCNSPSAATFGADITLNPSGAAGNQGTAGANGMTSCTGVVTESNGVDADVYLYQLGVYRGLEQLTSGGVAAQKVYWNVALGVKRTETGTDITDCWLRTQGTADDANGTSFVAGGTIAAGAVYPYIQWDVNLGTCGSEPLTFDGTGMVQPAYTHTTDTAATSFAYAYAPAAPQAPSGFSCTGTVCANATTGEVWVPAGGFWMGCNSVLDSNCDADEMAQHLVTLSEYAIDSTEVTDSNCDADEMAQHLVTLSEYAIDSTEVTAAAYKACVDAAWTGCTVPAVTSGSYATYDPAGTQDHPINYVVRSQASAYCAWPGKAAGAQRLCTEAEWEKAARGGCDTVTGDCSDGSQMRTYPWDAGDGSTAAEPTCGNNLANVNRCVQSTTAVGAYPAGMSPYGAYDMVGNVWEWVSDWYAGSYAAGAATDPTGPVSGVYRVFRGGYFDNTAAYVRASKRNHFVPSYASYDTGFRCCRSIP